ncbi:TPA: hypothetical protein HA246_02875 [Candidatus Woesearchaeota archaeon]|nr:hypothetical protein [Candidatus Woesearchaeota archaeon]
MTFVAVKSEDTIEDVVSRLISKVITTGHSQLLLANFTKHAQLQGPSFAGVGYSEGDKYDIRFLIENSKERREITIDYLLKENGKGLVGVYLDHTYRREIGNEKLQLQEGNIGIEETKATILEVGFTPKEGRRQILYDEEIYKTRYHKLKKFLESYHSKILDTGINLVDDARFVWGTLHSSETSLKRYRRGSVAPWLTVGIPIGIATSIAATGIAYLILHGISNK